MICTAQQESRGQSFMPMGWKRRGVIKTATVYCALAVIVAMALLPVFAIASTSIKHTVEVRTHPPLWISKSPMLSHLLMAVRRVGGGPPSPVHLAHPAPHRQQPRYCRCQYLDCPRSRNSCRVRSSEISGVRVSSIILDLVGANDPS